MPSTVGLVQMSTWISHSKHGAGRRHRACLVSLQRLYTLYPFVLMEGKSLLRAWVERYGSVSIRTLAFPMKCLLLWVTARRYRRPLFLDQVSFRRSQVVLSRIRQVSRPQTCLAHPQRLRHSAPLSIPLHIRGTHMAMPSSMCGGRSLNMAALRLNREVSSGTGKPSSSRAAGNASRTLLSTSAVPLRSELVTRDLLKPGQSTR